MNPLRAWLLKLVLLGVCFLAVLAKQPALAQSDREWRTFNGDPGGTKYSSLTQINRTNITQLKVAWIFRTGDMRQNPDSTIECNPLVIDGVIYVTTPSLRLVALNATNGKPIWQFDPWEGRPGRGVNRGLNYWQHGEDKRIFFSAGTFLYALNARDGTKIKEFGSAGQIDLREGLDQDIFFLSVSASSPGIIYQDLLIMGSVVGEGPNPAAPGHIRAFDVRSGKRRWIFHTIPHPGEAGYETWPPEAWKTVGGANCWGGFTLDEKRGLVFCGTGSPSYDHYGGNRAGQNLFANCVLALKAETGARRWHFQVVHHDLWDYDIPAPPNLVTVVHDGRQVDAVAQVTKVGHLFVLDRETGRPLFPVEERLVPRSDLPGEESWPTQPFPLKPPPFAQQRFTDLEVTDLSDRAGRFVREKLKGMRTGDVFLPPGLTPAVALPQFNGGGEWGGGAFDPTTSTLFVNGNNEAEWMSMVPSQIREEVTLNELGQHLYRVICSQCHGFGDPRIPASPSLSSLRTVRERLTRKQVLELLENGRGQMPSFASLSAPEKNGLVAFLFDEGRLEKLRGEGSIQLSWANAIPYVATGHNVFRDPDGYPANKRPWGTLNALDLNEGRIKWTVPLGTYPRLEAQGLAPTGTFNIGGPIVTAGGLVFIGASMDERFHAFDKDSGKLLWEYQMDAGGYATPCSYEIGGKQYVLIAAGGGGKPETKPGDAYYCFALP